MRCKVIVPTCIEKVYLLSKAEMRNVIGGDPGSPEIPGGEGGGTCAWHDGSHAICNLTNQ